MYGAEFVVWIVFIGVVVYFSLLEAEERRSRRIDAELRELLKDFDQGP